MNYLDMSRVTARLVTDVPNCFPHYGSRLKTQYMLQVERRWHRVYAICWGTAATCYIRKGGENLYIATGEL